MWFQWRIIEKLFNFFHNLFNSETVIYSLRKLCYGTSIYREQLYCVFCFCVSFFWLYEWIYFPTGTNHRISKIYDLADINNMWLVNRIFDPNQSNLLSKLICYCFKFHDDIMIFRACTLISMLDLALRRYIWFSAKDVECIRVWTLMFAFIGVSP